jgi:hypothetical protein
LKLTQLVIQVTGALDALANGCYAKVRGEVELGAPQAKSTAAPGARVPSAAYSLSRAACNSNQVLNRGIMTQAIADVEALRTVVTGAVVAPDEIASH